MKLSIIDQSPVPAGFTPAVALRNTIELARLADRLGYERYWIAEHHAIEALASPAPEILMARVAAETGSIRIGSGGVMLPHYSPLKVAEVFRVLHALYPGRIDLGIGRAPGASPIESYALWRSRGERPQSDDFAEQLVELMSFLDGTFPASHPFSRIKVSPHMPGGPSLWLLGSSLWSASAAAQTGLPYAFAHFIDPRPTPAALRHYQSHFVSAKGSRPRTIVAPGVICADSDAEAQRLLSSARLFRRRIRQGDLRPIPTPEEAMAELGSPPEQTTPQEEGQWPRYFAGTAAKVHAQLTDMAEALRADELMIVTVVHDHQARMRSYELLAEAFDLTPRPPKAG